jgi:hypothetical protein
MFGVLFCHKTPRNAVAYWKVLFALRHECAKRNKSSVGCRCSDGILQFENRAGELVLGIPLMSRFESHSMTLTSGRLNSKFNLCHFPDALAWPR